jgi:phosphonoacetaldehyde hydrolase
VSLLRAVVFDWAGTMIDFGCLAPVSALTSAFAARGAPVTEAEARADMGLAKRDHVRALLAKARVRQAWIDAHGVAPAEADGDALMSDLGPLMAEAAARHADLIPGAAEAAAALAARGVSVGSCTGYTREMMAAILPRAAAQGYAPASVVCAGETPRGRPSPLMMWKALVEMDAWPAHACVKVDDADVGIAEGRAAGAWTIGVVASGNGVGLSLADFETLSAAERAARIAAATRPLRAAGADYVIDSVADLMPAIEAIEARLAAGERPAPLV